MPHPKGSKVLYLSPETVDLYPNLTSQKLKTFLHSIPYWTEHIRGTSSLGRYLEDHKDVKNVLEELKIV